MIHVMTRSATHHADCVTARSMVPCPHGITVGRTAHIAAGPMGGVLGDIAFSRVAA